MENYIINLTNLFYEGTVYKINLHNSKEWTSYLIMGKLPLREDILMRIQNMFSEYLPSLWTANHLETIYPKWIKSADNSITPDTKIVSITNTFSNICFNHWLFNKETP